MPAPWSALQDAIFAWAVAASGCPSDQSHMAGPGRVCPARGLPDPSDPRERHREGPLAHYRTDPR